MTEALTEEILDAVQIGQRLGVHPVTVRRWMTTGELRTRKIGRRRVSRREWLDAFIDGRNPADGD